MLPPQVWRGGIEVVAIDPSAAFAKAIRTHLPNPAISVDAFHLVNLANASAYHCAATSFIVIQELASPVG
ncbi:hypothetical protein AXA44_39810 [Rhodococcus sp. SC4]|nr:hypothetical protein AXA44_39810 [Rhodococcus sp. SC4]